MATDYWISFRLEDDDTRQDRYEEMIAIIHECGPMFWEETTSFILLRSSLTIDELAGAIKLAIDEKSDTVLMRNLNSKSARLIGVFYDEDLLKFMDYIKRG